ncbi:MAG: hypothetical protein JKY37_30095 [Nannocystaceae bacterium]|nr:hypothetical protein [Nannocystaceae bacterium]
MKIQHEQWSLEHLRAHLQAAVDLEFWTIPFYMSAMYSIKDRSSAAYQMIRTVLNQEMLHLQCAANIANAYGLSPSLGAPKYEGKTIPHLDFDLDNPAAIKPYKPYTAEIGVLDLEHINGMCLVEIPDYAAGKASTSFHSGVKEYGSIGAFYAALREGAQRLKGDIKGGVRQVDLFAAFYRNTPNMVITESGASGFHQVALLIDLITDQGEGQAKEDPSIPAAFQNTADDTQPADDHFAKFNQIKDLGGRDGGRLPETYGVKPSCEYSAQDKDVQAVLLEQFTNLRQLLEALFRGDNPDDFFPVMASVGGAIHNCWKHGVTPRYSGTPQR